LLFDDADWAGVGAAAVCAEWILFVGAVAADDFAVLVVLEWQEETTCITKGGEGGPVTAFALFLLFGMVFVVVLLVLLSG